MRLSVAIFRDEINCTDWSTVIFVLLYFNFTVLCNMHLACALYYDVHFQHT